MAKLTEQLRPDNLSDKQFLVELHAQGELTTIQMRAAARALDRGAPLDGVLEAIEAGELELERAAPDQRPGKAPPTLKDVPAGTGPKQTLLWLRDNGALSPAQVRSAAARLNQGYTVEQALAKADAAHVLDKAPAPEEEKRDGQPPAPLTLGELVEKNIDDLKAHLARMEDKGMVLALLTEEVNAKNRQTAVLAIGKRAKELGAETDEVVAAIEQRERGPATAAAAQADLGRGDAGEEEEEEDEEGEE
jgi:hypothetical protein